MSLKALEFPTFEECPECGEENEMFYHVQECHACQKLVMACSMCDAQEFKSKPCVHCGDDGGNFRHKKIGVFDE